MIERNLCIYKLTYLPTGKIYIGQSRSPKYRLITHKFELERGIHHNKLLQADFNKYGGDLTLVVLEELGTTNRKIASDKEFEWMKKTRSYEESIGYNGNDPRIRGTKTNKYTHKMQEYLKSIEKMEIDD